MKITCVIHSITLRLITKSGFSKNVLCINEPFSIGRKHDFKAPNISMKRDNARCKESHLFFEWPKTLSKCTHELNKYNIFEIRLELYIVNQYVAYQMYFEWHYFIMS